MTSAIPNERRHVLYSGHVQGVGFRATTRRIAQAFAVTGFVRNLANGKVELVAEGSEPEIGRFLAQIADKLGDSIDDTAISVETATGEFRVFEIARS